MTTNPANDPDASGAILAVAVLAAVMPITVLVAPLLVGQLTVEFGFTAPQAGYLLSIELAAMCAATVIALITIDRVPWRRIVAISLSVAVLGNLLSTFADSFAGLAFIRAFVGLGSGTIMSLCLAAIGRSKRKDRNFGFWLISQLLSGVIGLAVLPSAFKAFGLNGFFIGVAASQALAFAVLRQFHEGLSREHETQNGGVQSGALAAIVSLLLTYVAISGIWAFVERIGHGAGLTTQFIGTVLATATALGIVGAGSAAAIGDRVKRWANLLVGFAILLVSLALLAMDQTELRYFSAAGLFKFTWTFTAPFILASISARDPSGRLIVISNFVLAGGIALGPLIGGVMLENAFSYAQLIAVMTGIAAIAAILVIIPEWRGASAARRKDMPGKAAI